MSDNSGIGILIGFGIIGWVLATWWTHVVTCLSIGSWGFLVAGALAFPVAVVHGTGVWFGWWGG